MADLTKTIQVVFGAVDKTAGGIESFGSKISQLENSVGSITGPLASVTDSIVKTELSVIALGAAMAGFAFNESVAYQSAALDLQKVLGDDEGKVADYEKSITSLSTSYAIGSTSVLEATANFRQSGFTIKESLDLADVALKAVNISELDVNDASRLLTATLKGFGAEAGDSARLLDIWNQISNESGASAGQLAIGMADLSPIARQTGLSFEETAALLTPVIEIFGSGSEAANSLKSTLLNLGSSSKPVRDALADLGISQLGANLELRSGSDILNDLAKVWPTLSKEQQLFNAGAIAGKEHAAKLSAVLADFNNVLEIETAALNAAGSATAEFQIRAEAAEFTIQRTGIAFASAAREIGDKFRPELTGVIGSIGDVARAFSSAVDSGGLEPLFEAMRPALVELQKSLEGIAQALPEALGLVDWDPILTSVQNLTGAFGDLFGSLDLTEPRDLAEAIQFVVDSIGSLTDVTAGIVDGIGPFLEGVKALADEYNALDSETKRATGGILGFATGLDTILPAIGSLGAGIDTLGTAIAAFLGVKGLGAITTQVPSVVAALGGMKGAAQGAFAAFVGWEVGSALYELPAVANAVATSMDFVAEKTGLMSQAQIDAQRPAEDLAANIELLSKLTGDSAITTANFAEKWEKYREAVQSAGGYTSAITGEFVDLNDTAKDGLISLGELTGQINETGRVIVDANGNITQLTSALDDNVVSTEAASIAIGHWTDATGKVHRIVGEDIDEVNSKIDDAKRKAEEWFEIVNEDGTSSWINVTDTAKEGISGIEDQLTGSVELTAELYAELQKIASDERIQTLKIGAEVDIAQIEADAEKFGAAIEGIADSIGSTNDLLGEMFGLFASTDSRIKGLQLEEWIDEQLDIQREQVDSQIKLNESLIRLHEAQANQIDQGAPTIEIDTNGVEPILEALLFEVMQKVRVRVTENYNEFLLGIGGATQ